MTINTKFIEYIINFINFDQKLNKLFKHHKQKYSINGVFDALLYKLNTGISYDNISDVFKHIKGGNLHYLILSSELASIPSGCHVNMIYL